MSFVFTQRAAIDEELGLKLENDLTFRDSMEVVLKLTDLNSGHEWSVPTPTISEPVSYVAKDGPHTSTLNVGVRLRSWIIRPIIADMAARKRGQGRLMTDIEAIEVFENALTTYFMRGGAMEKFFPAFRIEWA